MTPDRRITILAEEAEKEAKAIRDLLEVAVDIQWTRPKRGDLTPKGRGGPPSDPTGDTAADPRRLQVRRALVIGERHLLECNARLRGTRAALERAIAGWDT